MWVDRRSGTNEKGGLEDATNYSFNTYHSTLAAWTLRPALHKESGPKKLGANFKHSWVANWPQFTTKCQNIDVRILISAGTLAPRVANWPPEFDGILFPALLGPIQGHKVQHLLVLGQIEKFFFSISALTASVKPLGLLSTFAPIGMLDLG
jgi:hypothetical protein